MIKLCAFFGILGIVIFFAVAVVAEQLVWQRLNLSTIEQHLALSATTPYYQISIGGHLLIGIAMVCLIISFLGLRQLLEYERPQLTATLAIIFGIIACSIMVIQMTVQGTIMVRMAARFVAASDELQRQSVVALYRGLRLIDQGIDLAFDTFFFTAWMLLGVAMLRHRSFGKVFGTVGILLFAITIVVNVWSAPLPPSFEMSPIVSLWVLAVYVQMLRSAKSIEGAAQT
jgi:hypothetical protein